MVRFQQPIRPSLESTYSQACHTAIALHFQPGIIDKVLHGRPPLQRPFAVVGAPLFHTHVSICQDSGTSGRGCRGNSITASLAAPPRIIYPKAPLFHTCTLIDVTTQPLMHGLFCSVTAAGADQKTTDPNNKQSNPLAQC